MKELFNMVDDAYEALSGDALEKELLDICRVCAQEYGEDSPQYASMLSELGGFYRGQRSLEVSAECFSRAAGILESTQGRNSPDYAAALNNLAGTYRLMKKFDRAEELFITSLDIVGAALGTAHILYAAGLNNLSLVYIDTGDLTEATKLQREALGILRTQPQYASEFASALCNTASILLRQRQTAEAEAMLREASAMYENSLGTDTPHYHAALNALGLCLAAEGKNRDARIVLQKAMTAAEKMYGAGHYEYLAIKEALGSVEEDENDGT